MPCVFASASDAGMPFEESRTTKRLEKSTRASSSPSGGMMMPSTRLVTIFPNAAPITTATARSMTFPRLMKSRNSLITSLLDDGELRQMVGERPERRRTAERVLRGHGVVECAGHRVHRHFPHACPHLGGLTRVLRRREAADTAPSHRDVDDLPHVVQVH